MAIFHPSFLHFDLLINRMPFVRFSHVHYLHVGDGFQWQTYCECCSSSQESIIILDVESCGLWAKVWHEFLLQFLIIHEKKFPRPYLQLNSYKTARVLSVICLNYFLHFDLLINRMQFVRFSHVHYLHVGDGFQWQTYCGVPFSAPREYHHTWCWVVWTLGQSLAWVPPPITNHSWKRNSPDPTCSSTPINQRECYQ